jgi:hypothetical protein
VHRPGVVIPRRVAPEQAEYDDENHDDGDYDGSRDKEHVGHRTSDDTSTAGV